MNLKLKEKIKESLSAVLPITGIVLMLSIFLVPMELGSIVMFLTGAVMLIVGMGFFQLGAEMAMTPIGEGVGVQISKMKKLITVLLTGFVMGVIITVSEPDLQVLAGQVPSVPNAVLIMTVLTYCKLNDMCNAEAYCWSLRTTHKNQLQKKYSTIYRVCQEFRNYI